MVKRYVSRFSSCPYLVSWAEHPIHQDQGQAMCQTTNSLSNYLVFQDYLIPGVQEIRSFYVCSFDTIVETGFRFSIPIQQLMEGSTGSDWFDNVVEKGCTST